MSSLGKEGMSSSKRRAGVVIVLFRMDIKIRQLSNLCGWWGLGALSVQRK